MVCLFMAMMNLSMRFLSLSKSSTKVTAKGCMASLINSAALPAFVEVPWMGGDGLRLDRVILYRAEQRHVP